MASNYYFDSDDDNDLFTEEIYHGESVVDRKSVFQGHCARVYSVEQVKSMLDTLKQNKKIENAFHNMYAYRIDKNFKKGQVSINNNNKSVTGGKYAPPSQAASIIQDCDDDGEQAAGGRILTLLQILNVVNVVVVVTRWYGGIQLGPARFKHINNAARDALVKGGFVKDGCGDQSTNVATSTNNSSGKGTSSSGGSKANKKRSK